MLIKSNVQNSDKLSTNVYNVSTRMMGSMIDCLIVWLHIGMHMEDWVKGLNIWVDWERLNIWMIYDLKVGLEFIDWNSWFLILEFFFFCYVLLDLHRIYR